MSETSTNLGVFLTMTISYFYIGSLADNLATIGATSKSTNPTWQWIIRIVGFIATVAAIYYLTPTAQQMLDKS